jgi:serine/threonine-protein kinase RsbW
MIKVLIPSDLTEVDTVCRLALEELERLGLKSQAFPVELLLREFLNNAILHGNCADNRKKVQVSLNVGRKWVKIKISDEGPGFNWRKASRSIPDETAVSGWGLAIGSQYAEHIRYNRAGNAVSLWIKREN